MRFGRVPKREKAKILAAMQSSRMKTQESKVMGELNDDAKIIDSIVRAHYDTCDYTRKKMEPFLQRARGAPKYISCSGTTCPMKGRPEDSFMEQFSERFMDHVRQVCTFAKLIPGFKCLHHDDQVTLLKSCVFEVLLVRLAGLFDSQSLVCLNGDIIRKDTINAMAPGNAKFLMDSVFELAQRMNHFRLSDAEIGLFCAVVIITPDRPGLRNPELLMRIQNKLKMVLSSILLPQHPENESIFPELMTMIHDLRTLNTLHTEKFLQQCKINDHVPSVASGAASVASAAVNVGPSEAYEREHQRWDSNLDRESTGNGSPQSSSGGDTHSSTSLEDTSSRRSPMGSVSSTDSSNSEVCKLLSNVQDLRMSNNNSSASVLMTALTSTASSISRKASISTPSLLTTSSSTNCRVTHVTASRGSPHSQDSGVASDLCSLKPPSTNSLCSSPSQSSSLESVRSTGSASPPGNERHPLLKRALQQPPMQLSNNGGASSVASFQDEVYKPHKKFRRHNSSFSSKDDCPTSSTTQHHHLASPSRSSLLASQLASEPPSSLLASTLSQGLPLASEAESKRNEILAQLILNDDRCRGSSSSKQKQPPQQPQLQPPQGLLMCAVPSSWPQQPQDNVSRHIPVAALPTKPTVSRCPLASTVTSTASASSTVTSGQLNSHQPLNLSKRLLSKEAESEASKA